VIGTLLLTALLAQNAPDPCAALPAVERDPEAAAAYQAIGDEESAAGRREPAVVAYRAALARDPENAGARTALDSLCSAQTRDREFTRGLELFRAGRYRDALEPLEAARARGNLAAALLAGICHYRAGEDAAAATAFREAEQDPEARASAQLFLGLLALRRGRPAEAAPLLDSAAADPLLAPVARSLSRDLRRQGRVVVSLLAEGGWDSNADLRAGASFAPRGAGDGFVGGAAVISTAPWGESGPYARAAATWRDQLRLHEEDLAGLGAAAGLQLGRARRHVLVEGGYDVRRLGGRPYLSAPQLMGEGRLDLGDRWSVGAWTSLRWETFHAGLDDGSGLRQAAQADVTAQTGRLLLTAAWQGERSGARSALLRFREHGPVLAAVLSMGASTRVLSGAAWTWREYEASDPALERRRADGYADVAGGVEVDVTARWTVQLSVAGRRAYSNVPEFRYARVVSTLGLSWTMGL
jgi:tetratricopeptide (TPR) repeat protein